MIYLLYCCHWRLETVSDVLILYYCERRLSWMFFLL